MYPALQFRKTPWKERGRIRYEFANGDTVTIYPGTCGVTDADIRNVYRIEDHEVYINIKCSQPPMPEQEKREEKEWRKQHPADPWPRGWNVSLDACWDTPKEPDGTAVYVRKQLNDLSARCMPGPEERMRELVETLPPRLQAEYQLCLIDGMQHSRVARMMGVSNGQITHDLKRIRKMFENDPILRSFFREK